MAAGRSDAATEFTPLITPPPSVPPGARYPTREEAGDGAGGGGDGGVFPAGTIRLKLNSCTSSSSSAGVVTVSLPRS